MTQQQTPTPGPVPGDQLGDFRILHLIGEGAMGTVYRARDEGLDRPSFRAPSAATVAADVCILPCDSVSGTR